MLSSHNQAHCACCAGPQEVKLHGLHDVLFPPASEWAPSSSWRRLNEGREGGERRMFISVSHSPGCHQLAASLSQRQQLLSQCSHHILHYYKSAMKGLYLITGSTTLEKLPIFSSSNPKEYQSWELLGIC